MKKQNLLDKVLQPLGRFLTTIVFLGLIFTLVLGGKFSYSFSADRFKDRIDTASNIVRSVSFLGKFFL